MAKLIFKNYGRSYQLKIETAQDLEKIKDLDNALWAATSIPCDNLNCDKKFLDYIDTDNNNRIRTDEIRNAVTWLFHVLKNQEQLCENTDILRLKDIDRSHDEGKKIYNTAKLILSTLKKSKEKTISLSHVQDEQTIMSNATNNGDGIITPDIKNNNDLNEFIQTVIDTIGSIQDASGKEGINKDILEEFFIQANDYIKWNNENVLKKGENKNNIMVWGEDTPRAYEILSSIQTKIEQFFMQCTMIKFDSRTEEFLQFKNDEFNNIDFHDNSVLKDKLKKMSLAKPNVKEILNFSADLNPVYMDELMAFKDTVLLKTAGKVQQSLTKKTWKKIINIFIPYNNWIQNKKGIKVENIKIDKLTEYINGDYNNKVLKIIQKDEAVSESLEQIKNLEKLIYYQKWLIKLANNSVNFSDLYNPKTISLFEAGKLIIGGREITFTMKINNPQEHKKIAKKSKMYLLYLEITGENKEKKYEIAAAVTSGNADGLHIGKTGIFCNNDDEEFDAKITDIIDHPISPWETLKAPFKKIKKFATKQIDKFNKTKEDKLDKNLQGSNPSTMFRDILLGGSIAIAALGSSLAYITKALSQVKLLPFITTLAGLIAVILIPGVIIGFAKMRKKNISVLLEALEFSININMRLSSVLGKIFSHKIRIPKGSKKQKNDMLIKFVKSFRYKFLFLYKKSFYLIILFILLLVIIILIKKPNQIILILKKIFHKINIF